MKKSVIRMFDKKYRVWPAGAVLCLSAALTACGAADGTWTGTAGIPDPAVQAESADTIAEVPEYDGVPYVEINDNEPEFTEAELTTESYEEYSELDPLGRCGTAEACIGEDLMPDGEREDISEVEPTGWENREYDIVDGGYVYNRCHLIGFQLSGENANEENLITGTRYMNTEGMLPFENMVAEYVQETDNHVMYRVTPVFEEMTWWLPGCRWRRSPWKTAARASVLISMSTMCSLRSSSTTRQVPTGQTQTAGVKKLLISAQRMTAMLKTEKIRSRRNRPIS